MAHTNIPNDSLLREALRRRLVAKPQPKLPADFTDRVMAHIEKEKNVKSLGRHRSLWLYVAAACAALVIVGTLLLNRNEEGQAIAQNKPTQETVTVQPSEENKTAKPANPQPETKPIAKTPVPRKATPTVTTPVEQEEQLTLEESQAYTEMAINETDLAISKAEEAIALLCKNLDRGLSYIENLNIETT